MREYAIRRLALFVYPQLSWRPCWSLHLFWIVPGDAAYMILTGGDDDAGKVSLEQLEQLKEELGLNRPIYSQYGHWLWDILRGDLGTSIWYRVPVWDELENRFYVTIELSIIAIIMAFVVAVPLGRHICGEARHLGRLRQQAIRAHRHCHAYLLVWHLDDLRLGLLR